MNKKERKDFLDQIDDVYNFAGVRLYLGEIRNLIQHCDTLEDRVMRLERDNRKLRLKDKKEDKG